MSLFERFFDPTPTGVPALVRHVGSTLLITGSALFLVRRARAVRAVRACAASCSFVFHLCASLTRASVSCFLVLLLLRNLFFCLQAIVLPSIQVVFQLLGSSSSTLVCFLAPAFFALKVAHRGVARSDAVVVRAVKAPRCCGCHCSRAWLCGRGGAPAPSRAAQAVTAAGATHPSEGKRADAAQRSSVMLDVSQVRFFFFSLFSHSFFVNVFVNVCLQFLCAHLFCVCRCRRSATDQFPRSPPTAL